MPTVSPRSTTGAKWTKETWALWDKNVAPLFKDGKDWCSAAHYYQPRPYVDEYNRGSDKEGFTYVVQPGYRVCFWERVVK